MWCPYMPHIRGGSRIFFRRGCTCLLIYFNTNKPHSFFFWRRIPVVLENRRSSRGGGGMHTPCTLSLDPPMHILTLWREERFFRKWAWVQMIRCTHLCMFNCYKTIGLRRSWKYCFIRIYQLHDCRCRLGKYSEIVHMVFSYVRIQLSL